MSVTKYTSDPLFETLKYGGELPTRQAMLDAGTFVDAQDAAGNRLLHYAVLRGESRFAIDLLAMGAHVKAKDADGRTALHHAARMGNRYLVADLIAAGADVNAIDGDGRTPMHHAALGFMRHDHDDFYAIVRHLSRAGADLFAMDQGGKTPRVRLVSETQHLPNASVIQNRFPMS
ncbi:ankyrin repeat domain-containing protein [Paraburkholderia tropica]|uniref:ankyrin repeat domain-containing protein n=1 Tax=Paraburkholderia tropica TaxID=92647 RepID=UPI0007EDC263|nr:ankyrin repeat domain-containing protein [Paraburkholderia tropica]OBR53716.1 hypothetical protein A6456_12345 [Paraburkholderia tropica]